MECGEFGAWEVALYKWIIEAMWGRDDKEKLGEVGRRPDFLKT